MDTLPQQRVDEYERLAMVDYDPNRLLDSLIEKLHLESDTALASTLQVHSHIIAMLRGGKLCMNASMLLMLQRALHLGDGELRDLIIECRIQANPGDAPCSAGKSPRARPIQSG